MTVSTTTRKAGPFIGNGVTTVFPFQFKVFAKSDLQVVLADAAGAETVLDLDADYSVALNADQDNNPGGTVTYSYGGALPSTQTLTILSDVPLLQPTDIQNRGGFYPSVIEDALDRVTILSQQVKELLGRAIRVAVSDGISDAELPTAAARANKALVFDADGNIAVRDVTTVYYPPIGSVAAGVIVDDSVAANAGIDASKIKYVPAGVGATPNNVRDELRALQLADYTALRAYTGTRRSVYVTGYLVTAAPSGIAGTFVLDATDTTSADNGGTIIVDALGRRWKRSFVGPKHVDWFGANPSGTTNSDTAINNALATVGSFAETFLFSNGNYKLGNSITTTKPGIILRGASRYGTYFTAADGSTFPLLRIAHQQVEVSGFLFRPAAGQTALLIYAGRAHVHNNYLLAGSNNTGIGILLSDTNPDTSAFVPGAYGHVLENNIIGDSGFAFANGITENSTAGIQATTFSTNRILSNRPIQVKLGGGNMYIANLLQSSTGAPTGVGISLGANASGEKIWGNYFEQFQAMIETLNVSTTYQIFHAEGNHNDANTAVVADAGSKNYVIEDTMGGVVNRNGWSTRFTSTTWGVNTPSARNTFGTDTNGNCFMGAASGASHIINRVGSTENTVILNLQGAGVSIGYFQDARGLGINGANTNLALNKNSTTNRSINAAGTVNASGADYAEYMRKADGCGDVAKGQIIGIDSDGKVIDRWVPAIAFGVKSTDPCMVGGDTWGVHLGQRPATPIYVEPEYKGMILGRKPDEPVPTGDAEVDETTAKFYAARLATWESARAKEESDRAAHAQELKKAKAAYDKAMAQWKLDTKAYEDELEAERQKVDRIAFAGQVPVNVLGATPGQYIVAVQDGDGIKGIAKNEADMTLGEYMRAVGKVIAIEADGRARIIVKVS
jgi:hypothetical protein